MEFFLSFILGFILTTMGICLGYNLGRHSQVVPPDTQKQINQIFRKVIPNREVGGIPRPTAEQNYYRDNPRQAQEDQIMTKEIDKLNDNR